MDDKIKHLAYSFVGVRFLIDLTLSLIVYFQSGNSTPGIALMIGCSVFYLFMLFGIRKEEFRGRLGIVSVYGEPFAYWFIFSFLVLFHLIITFLLASFINW